VKVLLVATRSPEGRQTGRKTVLRTIARSVQDAGHEVRIVAVTNEAPEPTASPVAPIEIVRPPGPVRILWNAVTGLSRRTRCLNECLYDSPRVRHRVRKVARTWGADVVVADMIRTAPIALSTGLPVVVDLDDLLSRRYRTLADGRADAGTILGYYGTFVPRPLRKVAARLAARLVRIEASLVERRELAIAHASAVVSLVSREEGKAFAERIERPVAWLPMAVAVPSTPAQVADNDPDRLVFVGGLDYHANVEAVQWYLDHVVPELDAVGLGGVRLRVVGFCPPEARARLASPAGELAGYVDDLAAELAASRVFVAPIPPGTGVKTKVLEAMAAGLPVVSTTFGVTGIDVTPGTHALVADTGAAFAAAIAELAMSGARAKSVGMTGRALAAEGFAHAVVGARWAEVLDQLDASRGASPQ
jgi:glycosyltransferase involved in cell wall biosynthesis